MCIAMGTLAVRSLLNRIHRLCLVAIVASALSACMVPVPTPRTYSAMIERVDYLPGNFYSPREGPKPLLCLHLRVTSASRERLGVLLRVLVMDLHSAAMHGQPGDRVAFSYAPNLPITGELTFDALKDYRVIRNVN